LKAITFYKYQGTGNDFIMIDGREEIPSFSQNDIAQLCHRRFGIGADGLIILAPHSELDFRMIYYNSDGRESTMCGNGGRCIARFAADLLAVGDKMKFMAIDGEHQASLFGDEVALQMIDVEEISTLGDEYFADTGSPHHIAFADELVEMDLISQARAIRYNDHYRQEGVNVNFVKVDDNVLSMRTYERGVEDETYSCGTGVTAAAIIAHAAGKINIQSVEVQTRGGNLKLSFSLSADGKYQNIWLQGPATYVYKGEIPC
jgi:diaminopimelate epimerase